MRFLKSIPVYLGLGLLTGSLASPALAGSTESYKVELNKTEIVRLPGAAASVIIGNPKIADVTVQSSDLLFVVGRGYGETNLGDDTGFIGNNTSEENELDTFPAFTSSRPTPSSNQFDFNSQTAGGQTSQARPN